jgi:DNA primase
MDQVQEIKNKLNIVDIAREYIPQMKQAGTNWKALCPFHTEKTSSFIISQDKQIWHCFGCGEGGDIFEFVKRIENVDFSESLRILAKKAGVTLKKQDPKLLDLKSRLLDLQQEAAKFFVAHLWQTTAGKQTLIYLQERGLTEDTIKQWHLGYAPDGFDKLSLHLKKAGYAEHEIKQSGLVVVKERGDYFDRFHQRLMFPLHDVHGQIVGFTGRLLVAKKDQGKYVNSPQTVLYNKSLLLYGLASGKDKIKSAGQVVLVEGQMDVLQAHQAGFTNVVASSGTALTVEQLDILKRFAQEIIFAFDADSAGEKAILRSTDLALKSGWKCLVLILPPGEDPDSFIKKDPQNWMEAIAKASEVMEYFFNHYAARYDLATLDGKKQTAKALLALIAKLPDPIERDFYLQKLASFVNIAETALRESLPRSVNGTTDDRHLEISMRELTTWQKISQRYLAWLLVRSDWWQNGIESILPEMLTSRDEIELYSQFIVYYTNNTSDWSEKSLAEQQLDQTLTLSAPQGGLLKALRILSDDLRTLDSGREAENDWEQLLHNLQKIFNRQHLQELQRKLNISEQQGNIDLSKQLSTEINQLFARMTKLQ